MFLYIKNRINNNLDAEDLLREVFYKLSKSNTDKIENIKNWIYTVAKNTITDYYRKKKIKIEDVETIAIEEDLENDTIKEFSNSCIVPFVNQLPKEYQLVIPWQNSKVFHKRK